MNPNNANLPNPPNSPEINAENQHPTTLDLKKVILQIQN